MSATPLRHRTGSLVAGWRIVAQYVPVSDPFSGVTRDFWRAAGKIGEDCDVRDDLPSR
jgi:hypothetical protein